MYIEALKQYKPYNEQEANDQKVILDFVQNGYADILLRENEVAHMTSSSMVFNKTFDKVLMIHHNIYKTWAWTGGHADGDVDLLQVAIREAKEETGIEEIYPVTEDIISVDIIPVYGHVKRGKYVSSHLHLNISYALVADEAHALSIKDDENSGVMWVNIEDIAKYSNEPYLVDIYEKIIHKTRHYLSSLK